MSDIKSKTCFRLAEFVFVARMSEEGPPMKKVKVENPEEESEGACGGLEPEEGVITGVVTAEKAERMNELAEKLWQRDAKKAGLEGVPLEAAVVAALRDKRLSTLPDPLAHPPGAALDTDSWIQHGVNAGLWVEDEDCMLMEVC